MKVAAVCARGGSKGVPRKNLRTIGGLPLVTRAVQHAFAAGIFDRVVVSTDDHEIARIAIEAGAEVPFLRPASLARDDTPKWPVFQHLVTALEELAGVPASILADLDTGTPLRSPDDIRAAVDALASSDADVIITAYKAERNPYFNMVEVEPSSGYARVVKSCGRPVTRRQDAPAVYSLSPSVFAIRRDFLLASCHWSEGKVRIVEVPRWRAIDIDEEMDALVAEHLLAARMKEDL